MDEFKFKCPQCGSPIEADEALRGQAVECPFCGKGIVVPRGKPSLYPRRPPKADGVSTPFVPPRHHLPPEGDVQSDAENAEAGMVVNVMPIICLLGILVVGGWIFSVSRCDKKYHALKAQIEAGGASAEEVSQLSSRMEEMVSQLSSRMEEMKETHAALSREFEAVSRKLVDMETERRQYGEDLTSRNRMLEEKCTSLSERVETLSRQIVEISGSARQLERRETDMRLSARPQVVAQGESTGPDDSPKEAIAELKEKLARNLDEIQTLRKKNPACYLNPKVTSIINRENKIATMKDRRYCTCNNVAFVRDAFYCTGCKRITPYRGDRDYDDYGDCKVCRQMSFYRWLEARKGVDTTATINARLDELYAENESLEKQIQKAKTSRWKQ